MDDPRQPVFYYDLGSPQCYIAAETIMSILPVVPEWEPVLAANIQQNTDIAPEPLDRAYIERLANEHGLQPLRWPTTWPQNTERIMLAATYAKKIGRAVAFSLAAFRQAFAGGRDLGDEDTILIAGAACEMHPTALQKGMHLNSTATALRDATRRAHLAGATKLPAIQIGDDVYAGLNAILQAAIAIKR